MSSLEDLERAIGEEEADISWIETLSEGSYQRRTDEIVVVVQLQNPQMHSFFVGLIYVEWRTSLSLVNIFCHPS